MSTDDGTLTLRSFPHCPECGGEWPPDNMHIDGGHCPGRPQGCICQHDIRHHLEVAGCWVREGGLKCGCAYARRPRDYSKEDGS